MHFLVFCSNQGYSKLDPNNISGTCLLCKKSTEKTYLNRMTNMTPNYSKLLNIYRLWLKLDSKLTQMTPNYSNWMQRPLPCGTKGWRSRDYEWLFSLPDCLISPAVWLWLFGCIVWLWLCGCMAVWLCDCVTVWLCDWWPTCLAKKGSTATVRTRTGSQQLQSSQ